jgi:hypothetical protein
MIFRLLLPLLLLVSVGEVAAEAATIVFATGDARIVAADGVSRPAARGAAVEAGETVDTGDGKAQMKFRDGASIALQAGMTCPVIFGPVET